EWLVWAAGSARQYGYWWGAGAVYLAAKGSARSALSGTEPFVQFQLGVSLMSVDPPPVKMVVFGTWAAPPSWTKACAVAMELGPEQPGAAPPVIVLGQTLFQSSDPGPSSPATVSDEKPFPSSSNT